MINQIMLDDIMAQPEAIAATLPEFRAQVTALRLSERHINNLIFAGSGDSYYAPLSLWHLYRRHTSLPVYPVTALDAASYWHYQANDLLVAISFSGESARTKSAARRAREAGARVLAITANEDSGLAELADDLLLINWQSPSRSIPHTVDYMTSLLAIASLLEGISGARFQQLDCLSDHVAKSLEVLLGSTKQIAQSIASSDCFFLLGAGPNWATAQYGAEKFWEACGIRASSFELEEFAHGPHKLIDAGDPIVLLAVDHTSAKQASLMAEGLRLLGGVPILVSHRSDFSTEAPTLPILETEVEWSPFVAALPLQLLVYSVATHKGFDVVVGEGRVKNIQKVREIQKSWIR